jgi:dTDP-4-dehydrorhamnose reductase
MKVLVLGGGGWLGSAVVPRFRARFDTLAPRRTELDVADEAAVRRAFASFRPDAVVNLAALQPTAGGEDVMARVNAAGAGVVARAPADAGVRLVHMSTDAVLDGRSPPYRDDAPPSPVHAYGRTKAAGEAAVLAACPGALIVRTSLVFDPRVPDRFMKVVLDRMERGEPSTLFTDEVRCPIARGTLAAALAELATLPGATGRLNVAGTQPLSRDVFGTRLLRALGAKRLDLLRTARAADSPDPRPLDLTLDVSRARALLSTPLRSVDEELVSAR